MRHITENRLSNLSADSENANYPIANTQDTHPSKPWKAADGVSSAVISADCLTGISDIAIFGTNAVSASVTAEDPNVITWGDDDEWGDDDIWANTGLFSPVIVQYQRSTSSALWLRLSGLIEIPVSVAITLSADTEQTVYAGIVQAGIAETYGKNNPRYGLTITPVDTSITREMSNGSRYYKKRNILRSFGVDVLMKNAAAFDLLKFFQTHGAVERPWKITDLESNEWVIFGHITLETSFDYLGRSTVNMTLTEVL